jgi:hypothetical protein
MPILVSTPLTQADIPGIVAQAVKATLDTVIYTDRKGAKVTVRSPRGPYAYDQVTDGGSIDLRLDKLEATALTVDAALKANGVNDAALSASVATMLTQITAIKQALADPPAILLASS